MFYPTPIDETLRLDGPKPFKATLQEPPIPGDSSATARDPSSIAARSMQEDLKHYAGRQCERTAILSVRVGVNSGEVLARLCRATGFSI